MDYNKFSHSVLGPFFTSLCTDTICDMERHKMSYNLVFCMLIFDVTYHMITDPAINKGYTSDLR
jgi:hypothetical protein